MFTSRFFSGSLDWTAGASSYTVLSTDLVADPGFLKRGPNSLLPPANVVCEGYVFTRVCHSSCSQGVYLVPGWGVYLVLGVFLVRGVYLVPGGRGFFGGGVQGAWFFSGGVVFSGGMVFWGGGAGSMSMSGRYASYWNAFLFGLVFTENSMKMERNGLGTCMPYAP